MTEGQTGKGVPGWVGGRDRGQMVRGSVCLGKGGRVNLKYITKPLKHGKHGTWAKDKI